MMSDWHLDQNSSRALFWGKILRSFQVLSAHSIQGLQGWRSARPKISISCWNHGEMNKWDTWSPPEERRLLGEGSRYLYGDSYLPSGRFRVNRCWIGRCPFWSVRKLLRKTLFWVGLSWIRSTIAVNVPGESRPTKWIWCCWKYSMSAIGCVTSWLGSSGRKKFL